MKTQHFTVNKDNQKIRGIAYLCDRCEANLGEKAPAIIMSHGYLSSLSNYDYFAPKFCELGYNVYTFNFCCGSDETDPELKSDGDTKELCIEGEVNDLLAVYNYVTLQECVKSDEIYLWGESQGAFVSGLVAARLQEKVKKLVMIFPAVCIPDHARRGMLGGAVYDPMNPPDIMPTDRATLGRCFHDGVKDMNPYYELAEFKGETLLIQGDEDSVVVPQYQYLVKDAFDKTDAGIKILREKKSHRLHLQMVRGMDHWTGGEHREGLAESIKLFLDGKEEILTFRIIATKVVSLDDNDKATDTVHAQDVYFTGYSESKLFTGTITSGVDHQKYRGDECLEMKAEYTFEGIDEGGQYCKMDVLNIMQDGAWKPRIKTDSKNLFWLNEADLSAVVENGPLGPTIRIYK